MRRMKKSNKGFIILTTLLIKSLLPSLCEREDLYPSSAKRGEGRFSDLCKFNFETVNNKNGVTLVELVIVVSVIGILAVALGFSFQGWVGRYKAESQIKELYTDLMSAKISAMQKNRAYFVRLTTTLYTVYEDTYDATQPTYLDGDGLLQTASDRRVLQKELEPNGPITWSGGAQLEFSKKGIANSDKTICSGRDVEADYDCIGISALKINTGKLTTRISSGGVCNAANCVTK